MCFYCKGDMVESTTVFTVQFDNTVIIVKNVPCKECVQCGETEISDEVFINLEKIIDKAKSIVQEVSVLDYRVAA